MVSRGVVCALAAGFGVAVRVRSVIRIMVVDRIFFMFLPAELGILNMPRVIFKECATKKTQKQKNTKQISTLNLEIGPTARATAPFPTWL